MRLRPVAGRSLFHYEQEGDLSEMYKQVDKNLNFVEREKAIEKFWADNDIFQKSMDSRKDGPTYTFSWRGL